MTKRRPDPDRRRTPTGPTTEPLRDADKKLAVVRAAAQHAFPTA